MYPFALIMAALSVLTFFVVLLLTAEPIFDLFVITQVWCAAALLSLERK